MLPHWQSIPLTEDQIDQVVANIERDPHYGRPLHSDQDAAWSSKDLKIGVQQDRHFDPVTHKDTDQNSRPERKIIAEHFDVGIQEDAFRFLGSDARIEKRLLEPLRWISLPGITRTFYHFQVYGAFWLLCQERGVRRGSIQADMMGLGKTTMAFLYVIFNCLLAEIAEHRRQSPHRHNRGGSRGSCPSQSMWPIQCSCVRDSVIRRRGLYPVDGPTLVFVPTSLLSTWLQEWGSMGVSRSIPVELYVHHHDFREERRVPGHQRHHLRLSLMDDGSLSLESSISHRFVVITTIESYLEQVVRLFANLNGRGGIVNAAGISLPGSHDGIGWARVIRDEAHLTTNYRTRFFSIMQSFISRNFESPNLLALTATPMLRQGVTDMLALVRTINGLSTELQSDPRYAGFITQKDMDKLSREQTMLRTRQRANAGDEVRELQQAVADSTGRLQTLYCIRRRNSSIQNGKPLASIPPIVYYDVSCPSSDTTTALKLQRVEWLLKKQLTPQFKEQQKAWARRHPGRAMEDIEVSVFLDNASLPRILATLPLLSESPGRQSFTWAFIEDRGWHLQPERSLLAADIQLHRKCSGKLQQLQRIVEKLGVDVKGRPEKLVVVSEFPVVCLAVLVLLRSIGIPTEWMHAKLDATDREALASNFQSGRDMIPGEVECRVLVGSTRILGQGITLHRAFRLVLMEPSRHAAVEAQASKRIHRIGTEADKCWIYRLINPSSRIEALLVLDQKSQRNNEHLAGSLTEVGSAGDLDTHRWDMGPDEEDGSRDEGDFDGM